MRHRIVPGLVLLCLWGILAAPVWGDAIKADNPERLNEQTEEKPASPGAENDPAVTPSMTDMLLPSLTRIGLSLLIIIGVIYISVFLMRRLSGRRTGGGKGKTIQVIEQTFLSPKKSVCLLKLADRAVLVGITEANISLLTEMAWDELPKDFLQKATERRAGFQGFLAEAAGKLLGAKNNKGAGREHKI
jgi:flagellar biosynthetic protein FliO